MFGQTTPPELFEKTCWYACRTKSSAEKKVQQRLSGAGFEAYLPVVEEKRQWADRKKTVAFPLFPGYLFARFCLTELHEVLGLPGVASVLRPNGYPTPVRDDDLASLRRFVEGVKETGALPSPCDFLERGRDVVVVSGPFEGMRGVMVEERGRARVVVRIGVLRQATSVQLDRVVLKLAG
jgi:transcription antitermination factor NusG